MAAAKQVNHCSRGKAAKALEIVVRAMRWGLRPTLSGGWGGLDRGLVEG
jgi:hypothetical protein